MAVYLPAAGAQIVDRNTGALIEYADGKTYYDLGPESGLGGNQYGPNVGEPIDNPEGLTASQWNAQANVATSTPTTDVFGNVVGTPGAASTGAVQYVDQQMSPTDPNYYVYSPTPTYQSSTTNMATSTPGGYLNIQGTYWQQGSGGELALVNDPAVLQKLQSGELSSTSQASLGSATVGTFTNPELIPGGATVPTNVNQVTSGQNYNVPSTTVPSGNISSAVSSTAGMNTMLDTLIKQQQDYQAQLTQMQAQNAQLQQSWLQKLTNQQSPAQIRAETLASLGMNAPEYFAEQKALIEEINALTQEYNNIKANRDAQIAQSYDRLGSMNFINNQIAQIERNAAPWLNEISANINAKAAVLQAKQGLFAEANNYASQAVQDVTWQYQYEFQMFQTFYQMNQDQISRLDTKYQNAFNQAMDIAKMQWQVAREDAQNVMNLMIQYPNAGINPNDALQTAAYKAQVWQQNNPASTTSNQIIGSADTGYTNVITDQYGNVVKKETITGGVSGTSGGFSSTEKKALSEYLGQVASYNSRDEAITDLNKYQAKILVDVGQAGYDAILAEVDRLFPKTPEVSSTATKPTQSNVDVGSNFPGWIQNTVGAAVNWFSSLLGE